jgi:6-phosphogluconate dehydrogenase
LLADDAVAAKITTASAGARTIVGGAVLSGLALPAYAASLSYFDSISRESMPSNLIQAQRDYFGAHTYERVDASRGKFFHVDWPDPKRPQRPV